MQPSPRGTKVSRLVRCPCRSRIRVLGSQPIPGPDLDRVRVPDLRSVPTLVARCPGESARGERRPVQRGAPRCASKRIRIGASEQPGGDARDERQVTDDTFPTSGHSTSRHQLPAPEGPAETLSFRTRFERDTPGPGARFRATTQEDGIKNTDSRSGTQERGSQLTLVPGRRPGTGFRPSTLHTQVSSGSFRGQPPTPVPDTVQDDVPGGRRSLPRRWNSADRSRGQEIET